eukprot:17479-Heterococcus_DN1.PRE.2
MISVLAHSVYRYTAVSSSSNGISSSSSSRSSSDSAHQSSTWREQCVFMHTWCKLVHREQSTDAVRGSAVQAINALAAAIAKLI